MAKWILIASGVLLSAGVAVGADFNVKGLGFIAPQVNDKDNVTSPHLGEIIFDSSDSVFYGRDSSSSWVPFSGTGSQIPTGTILPFAGTSAPAGYRICDGSEIDCTVSTYSNLCNVMGGAFGTRDQDHMNLPDLRGRFLRGVDSSENRDPGPRVAITTGGNTGNAVGSLESDSIQNITGTFPTASNFGSYTGPFARGSSFSGNGTEGQGNFQINFDASLSVRTSSETRPVNVNVNYMIKL
jgi:hypothetical protein